MPSHASARIAARESVAGVIIVSRRLSVSQVINELEVIVSCSNEKNGRMSSNIYRSSAGE
jgi:hypothetical protein